MELSPSFSKVQFGSFRGEIVWAASAGEFKGSVFLARDGGKKSEEFSISTHLVRNQKDFGQHFLCISNIFETKHTLCFPLLTVPPPALKDQN